MRIDCVSYLHDVEDKPSVTLHQMDPFHFYCCSHITYDLSSNAPLSRAAQTVIMRFAQEAFNAQFFLARGDTNASKGKESALLSYEQITSLVEKICQQITFFLDRHGWKVHLHLLAFLSAAKELPPDHTLVITIGSPSVMGYDEEKKEPFFLQGKALTHRDQNHFFSSVGALGGGQKGEIVMEAMPLARLQQERFIVGAPQLQFLQTQALRAIYLDDWDLLDQTLLDILRGQDFLESSPFTCIQVSRGGKLRQFSHHLRRALFSLTKHPTDPPPPISL